MGRDGYGEIQQRQPQMPSDLLFHAGEAIPGISDESLYSGAVRLVYNHLEAKIGTYEFNRLFGTILTDRGVEFGKPQDLETGIKGVERTSIYFCDPMRSCQKGGVENVHTLLRMVLPKGTSFEFLTQWDVNLIVNHINSMPRKSLNGSTPYNVSAEAYGEEVLKKLQLRRIDPDEVKLSPKLIRNN